ncbi:MAG: DegV family protein [Desulfobacter sp.]|nr:MAG: DegV family protein [Desulfobacter sp.]
MKRIVVTDSTADIPKDVIRELGIKVMPVNLILDSRSYRDGEDISRDGFYEQFGTFTTMASAPVRYEDYALDLLEMTQIYDEILAIHCSKYLSETYGIAEQIRSDYLGKSKCRVEVIDSGQCSMGLGMVVIEAAKAMKAGKDFDRVARVAGQACREMKSYMAIPTLKYLRKNKKIGGMKALFGLAMGVKPVLEMNQGKMVIKSKLMGKQKNMILSMIDRIREDVAGRPISLSIIYSGDKGLVRRLRDVFEETFDCRDVYITRFGPSVAINTGPESYAVFFIPHEES